MILPVYVYGHPLLRKQSEEIGPDYPDLQALVDDMFETMYHAEGVGLAAPQVGLSIRLIVIDGTAMAEDKDPNDELRGFRRVLINPEITARGGEECTESEGCLSLPGMHENIRRPQWIEISYMDEHFVAHHERYEGMRGRIIQHEYDHLEGKLFVDRLSPLRRKLVSGRLSSISRGKADCKYKVKLAK